MVAISKAPAQHFTRPHCRIAIPPGAATAAMMAARTAAEMPTRAGAKASARIFYVTI